jgi:2-polyprenyl-3-methyl-5-hydroxy-6-metoxy-1,4-benzoquinol methylase
MPDKLFHCSDDAWDLYACDGCSTHYLDPRPDTKSIARAYATYLTHEAPALASQPASTGSLRDRAKHAVRALANDYRNARWGTRLQPHLRLGRSIVPCIPFLRGALVQQACNLPGPPERPDARLLDVGCGNGAFLQLARSAGWSVQGIDFDAVALAVARRSGLDVREGGLEVLQATAPASFGWVNLSHVLEHVHDPVTWLQALHRVTEPGGTLSLQTPNIESIGHGRYAENWRDLDPPRHLTLWTLDTLRQTLKQAGFRQVRALRTPVFTAMEVYATSEGLQRGMDYQACAALPGSQRRRMRYLWPALRQYWSLRRSEFLTLLATR